MSKSLAEGCVVASLNSTLQYGLPMSTELADCLTHLLRSLYLGCALQQSGTLVSGNQPI